MLRNTDIIDMTPFDAAAAASRRAQHQRLGRHGLALARDGTIRCVHCEAVVMALPRGASVAIGTTGAALAAHHKAAGCGGRRG